MTSPLPALLALLLILVSARAQLLLHASGPLSDAVATLSDTATICPSDFPRGFNLQCKGLASDRRAIFFVDGVRKRADWQAPFFLLGNRVDFVKRWRTPEQPTSVECQLESATYVVHLTFGCPQETASTLEASPSPASTPTPSLSTQEEEPSVMYFRAAGASSSDERQVRITNGLRFCPENDVGSSDFTVFCSARPDSPRARFRVNREQVFASSVSPYFIAGDTAQGPLPWSTAPDTPFALACFTGSGVQVFARDVLITCEKPEPIDTTACVVLPATEANVDPDAPGWIPDTVLDGMSFNAGNKSKELVRAGTSVLNFDFVAPATSQFAVVLDMTTSGRADYNDVYMRFAPRGFQLINGDSVSFERSWRKGYHKFAGRGARVSTQVDHTPHSISTAEVLQIGRTYQFRISGRSNQVTIHNVLLFPCEGAGCQRKGTNWNSMQEACLPGSTLYTPKPKPVVV